MLFSLIEFGSVFFCCLFGAAALFESAFLHRDEGESATFILIVISLVGILFVGNWPKVTYEWVAAYFLGGAVWVPVYWYLTLRKNRSRLLSSTRDAERCDYGIQRDNLWLPKHPSSSSLVANGTVWFLSAPIHLSNNWINMIIDLLTNIMSKVQKSLAVEVNNVDAR